jgi:hypothetical protein
MDPKAFEQLIAAAQAQPNSTPVVPVDPTEAILRQSAAIRGPSSVAVKARVRGIPDNSKRFLAESALAEQEANALLDQLFAPQQQAVQGLKEQREKLAAKDASPEWAMPLLGITDTWLNSDSVKKFKDVAMTPEEKQATLLALDKQIGDDEAAIAKQKVDLIKANKGEELGYAKLAQMYDRMLASQLGGGLSALAMMRYDDQMQKTLERLGNALTGYEKSRNTKALLTQQLSRAAKIRQVLGDKKYDDLTSVQVAELAESIVPLITGGAMASSEARLRNFLPSNIQMTAAQVRDYLTSKPGKARQGEFVKMVEQMLNAESSVLQRELDSEKRRLLPQFARLYRDPATRQDMYQVAAGRGIAPEEVDDFFNSKNRKKMVDDFKATGDVPGSQPITMSSGRYVPESYRSIYTQLRNNPNNARFSDEQLLAKAEELATSLRKKGK